MRGLAKIARTRRRRYPPDGLAEPVDLRCAGRQCRACDRRHLQRRAGCRGLQVRAGLVACTGNRGCKFAASDTKGHALDIVRLEGAFGRRSAGQYPSDRLPPFLRAALCRRYRAARHESDGRRRRRSGRGLSVYVGGGFGAEAESRGRSIATSMRRRAEALLKACCVPILPIAPRRMKASTISPRLDVGS